MNQNTEIKRITVWDDNESESGASSASGICALEDALADTGNNSSVEKKTKKPIKRVKKSLKDMKEYNRMNAARFRKRRKEMWGRLHVDLRESAAMLAQQRQANKVLQMHVGVLLQKNRELERKLEEVTRLQLLQNPKLEATRLQILPNPKPDALLLAKHRLLVLQEANFKQSNGQHFRPFIL